MQEGLGCPEVEEVVHGQQGGARFEAARAAGESVNSFLEGPLPPDGQVGAVREGDAGHGADMSGTRQERFEIDGGARIELNLPSGATAFLPGEADVVEVTGEGREAEEFVIEEVGERTGEMPSPPPPPSPTDLPTGDTGRAARLRVKAVCGDATLARADTR